MIAFGWVFAIVTSIVFWGIALESLVRSLRIAGLKLWYKEAPVSCNKVVYTPLPLFKWAGLRVLLFAALVRLVMAAISYVMAWYMLGHMPNIHQLMYVGSGWDNYHRMAEYGYSFQENGRNIFLVFFPLYIYLIRILNAIVENYLLSAYIISFASYILGIYYLYRLVRLEFSQSVAMWTVVFISVAPTAFYFGTPMTESLMLLTSAATLYYIRLHNWKRAGIAGAFAMATRMVGAMLVVVAFVEFFMHYKVFALVKQEDLDKLKELATKKAPWILLIFTGGLVYLFINWLVSGDPFRFTYYQRVHWHNTAQYFGQVILNQFRNIASGWYNRDKVNWTFIPNIIGFAFGVITLAYACVKKHSTVYIIYALGYIAVSYAVSWLLSGARYIVVCIPLFIFLACMLEKRPVLRWVVTFLFIVGMLHMRYVLMTGGPVF